MKTVRVSDLEGAALDWAVAKAVGFDDVRIDIDGDVIIIHEDNDLCGLIDSEVYKPSARWGQCGPLIENHIIMMQHTQGAMIGDSVGEWMATATYDDGLCLADSPLIASCRAIVAANIGDEVDVPDELVETA